MKKYTVISKEKAIWSRLQYTLDFINNHPLNDKVGFYLNEDLPSTICYGADLNNSDLKIPCQNLFYDSGKSITANISGKEIRKGAFSFICPTIINHSDSIEYNGDIDFDLFESIFFHISRYEEYHCENDDKNQWDTKEESKQFLVKNEAHKTPQVDQMIQFLIESLTGQKSQIKSEFIISHDIDHISKFTSPFSILKKIPGHIINRKTIKGLGKLVGQFFNYLSDNDDPFDTFDWMLIDKNIHKRIYFLVGGEHKYDTPINLEHPKFKKALDLAFKNGYEIGIHPSYESWQSEEKLRNEKNLLEEIIKRPITNSRQHYLHFDFKQTFQILQKAGLENDSSLGYNQHVGFRCGTGFSYNPYDFENEQAFEIIETPLVFMDSACLHEAGHDASKFESIFNQFFQENKFNTQLCCNFHNSFFDDAEMRGIEMKRLYSNLIAST